VGSQENPVDLGGPPAAPSYQRRGAVCIIFYFFLFFFGDKLNFIQLQSVNEGLFGTLDFDPPVELGLI
jgi:hypothetical protein